MVIQTFVKEAFVTAASDLWTHAASNTQKEDGNLALQQSTTAPRQLMFRQFNPGLAVCGSERSLVLRQI
jgi:hypothetical protein